MARLNKIINETREKDGYVNLIIIWCVFLLCMVGLDIYNMKKTMKYLCTEDHAVTYVLNEPEKHSIHTGEVYSIVPVKIRDKRKYIYTLKDGSKNKEFTFIGDDFQKDKWEEDR